MSRSLVQAYTGQERTNTEAHASLNTASIIDSGVTQHTATFTNAFTDALYTAIAQGASHGHIEDTLVIDVLAGQCAYGQKALGFPFGEGTWGALYIEANGQLA